MKIKFRQEALPGSLIVFCGMGRSGKTTMTKLLTEHLLSQGISPIITKQPSDEIRSLDIFRTYMEDANESEYDFRALSLMAAGDHIQNIHRVILPLLQDGATVISDGYFFSCIAKLWAMGYKRDKWILELSSNILLPDRSFFLDIDVNVHLQRIRQKYGDEKYIDFPYQYNLREEYLNIAEMCGGVIVDSNDSPLKTFENVLKFI